MKILMSGKNIAFALSILLHGVMASLLILSVDFSSQPPVPNLGAQPTVIDAVAIDESELAKQVNAIKKTQDEQRRKEQERVNELERRANQAEKRRKEQEQQVADLKKETKQQQASKKQADQAAASARAKQKKEQEKAQQLERQRKAKEEERVKAEEQARQAKAQREKEEKALQEAQRKKREAEAEAEQQRQLEQQLQAEQATRQAARGKQVLSEVQKYQALIKQTIQRNLIVDDAMKGKSCRLNIRLASNGLVTKVTELAGDPILCRAAKSAVFKSDTLPVSEEADVYEKLRDINLTVEPEL